VLISSRPVPDFSPWEKSPINLPRIGIVASRDWTKDEETPQFWGQKQALKKDFL
jgi:hypothetical protein